MKSPWLVLDVSSIAYRSLYTTGDLSHEGVSTGVLFGIFRLLIDLMDLYATEKVAFCFDGGKNKRNDIFPPYKHHKKSDSDEMQQAREIVRDQLIWLKDRFLPQMGFSNVFQESGYEADDVIASICDCNPDQSLVIVSSDHDLYQLLEEERVWIWSLTKKRPYTEKSFRQQYGIDPKMWVKVKAIAGCASDGVVGLYNVGEKRAIQFLTGGMRSNQKVYMDIFDYQKSDPYKVNVSLVLLPFPGTPRYELEEDHFTPAGWERVMDSLGMSSLRDRGRRKKKKGLIDFGEEW